MLIEPMPSSPSVRPKNKRAALARREKLRSLIGRHLPEVESLLDQGVTYDAIAAAIGKPSASSLDVRWAVLAQGLSRRPRVTVKQEMLARHHSTILDRLKEGRTYKEILVEIGNEELTVPDLARYVISHHLPARQRGQPPGRRHGDPELEAREAAFAIKSVSKGATLAGIASQMGYTKEAVRLKLIKAGHPTQGQVIAQDRLLVLEGIMPLLREGLSYEQIAQQWNANHKTSSHITWNFMARIVAVAEKRHYERLNERLSIREIHQPDVRKQWSFLPKLLIAMEEVRAILAKRPRVRHIEPRERCERVARLLRNQSGLFMTTFAKAARLKRSAVVAMVHGVKSPDDAQWAQLCKAFPGLTLLGYEMISGAAGDDQPAPPTAIGAVASGRDRRVAKPTEA